MADIGTPFSFTNPERYGNANSKLRRPATYFSPFSRLPYELRRLVIDFGIQTTLEYREEWLRGQCSPIVLQSRRGVLRVQTQHKEPLSLPQLACISKEWQEVIEKQLFKALRLKALPDCRSGKGSDLNAFSAIVIGPRCEYLRQLRLDSYREFPTYQRPGSGNAASYRTGGNYECIMTLFQILGSWTHGNVGDVSLALQLDIELHDFTLHYLKEAITNLPSIPVVRRLVINMKS